MVLPVSPSGILFFPDVPADRLDRYSFFFSVTKICKQLNLINHLYATFMQNHRSSCRSINFYLKKKKKETRLIVSLFILRVELRL